MSWTFCLATTFDEEEISLDPECTVPRFRKWVLRGGVSALHRLLPGISRQRVPMCFMIVSVCVCVCAMEMYMYCGSAQRGTHCALLPSGVAVY